MNVTHQTIDPVADLSDLWNDELCDWKVELRPGDEWCLTLIWTHNDAPHDGADDRWVTYSWQFFAPAVDDAIERAVEWCWALTDLAASGRTTPDTGDDHA